MIRALLLKGMIFTENSEKARALAKKHAYGALMSDGRVRLSWLEVVFLASIGKVEVVDFRSRIVPFDDLMRKASRAEHDFATRYVVFSDLRKKGYVVKTALKFGADFRVYDKGVLPGQDHARWIVYPVRESSKLTWQDFASKNRVAHSTKKSLLIAVVDDEFDVTYWEVGWLKP
ncbi:tRNA-intron lyase [Candidatus Woesearchaeota archaeon]|nr:MAG: tRNA-intron lyase [Candidatus Woesearchaeota archaeon]